MGMLKLAKAWSQLKLTKSRCSGDGPWLRWNTDAPEDRGDPGIKALELNCPMILCMFQQLRSLDPPPIKPLMAEAPYLNLCMCCAHLCVCVCVF